MLYNGIANGGRMMKPYLVSAIRQYGKDVKRFEPTAAVEKMGDTGIINQLRKCTAEVVLSGTGKAHQEPSLQYFRQDRHRAGSRHD